MINGYSDWPDDGLNREQAARIGIGIGFGDREQRRPWLDGGHSRRRYGIPLRDIDC